MTHFIDYYFSGKYVKKKENTDEWKGLVKTKHTFAETFKMERVFMMKQLSFSFFFPIYMSFFLSAS